MTPTSQLPPTEYEDLIDWLVRADEFLADGEVALPNGRVIQYAGDPYGKRLLSMLKRVLWLHTGCPGDEWAAVRCNACVAGYDPKDGQLVQAAWPCQTIQTVLAIALTEEVGP